jgi:hypothetical protein
MSSNQQMADGQCIAAWTTDQATMQSRFGWLIEMDRKINGAGPVSAAQTKPKCDLTILYLGDPIEVDFDSVGRLGFC